MFVILLITTGLFSHGDLHGWMDGWMDGWIDGWMDAISTIVLVL